jgi:hypothetical protein
MASIRDLPFALREIAQGMSKDLLDRLTAAELEYRLEYVAKLRTDSQRITNPAASRAVSAKAKKARDAMPFYELNAQVKSLQDRIHAAGESAGNSQTLSDISSGYYAAVRKLQESNPQAPGIDAHLSRLGVAPAAAAAVGVGPSGSSLSDSSGRPDGLRAAKQARVRTRADAEIAKHKARLERESAALRREIEALKALQETDLATATGVVADLIKGKKS